MLKKTMVLTAAIAAILSSGNVLADASVNAAATNNYLWRGVTQSTDTASVSGGVDWSGASGLYAGVWSGSLVDGTETDLYAGFKGKAGSLGYDVGVITYQYTPAEPSISFTEAYLNFSFGDATIGVASTIDTAFANEGGQFDEGDMYVNASYDFKVGVFDTSIFGGSYMFENDNLLGNGDLDYSHYGVSFTSGEVTVALEKNDITTNPADDNVRVVATWSREWDL